MNRFFIVIVGLLVALPCAAQSVEEMDSLLLNAEYAQVIALVEQYNGNDIVEKYLLLNKKAEALTRLGRISDSEALLKKLSEQNMSSPFLRGVTKTTYGQLYTYQGRLDRAEELTQEALREFDAAGKGKSLEAAQAISQLGLLYKYTGKDAQAEEQMRMALTYRENILSENSELIGASYNDLGLIYSDIDSDKALDFYEKALKIYEKLHGAEHPKIAIANSNIGFVYRSLELYGDAINNFETALKIWEKVQPGPHQAKAFNLHNLGRTYKAMNDAAAAKGYFDRALKMYRDSYGQKHPDIANVLNDMGMMAIGDQDYTVAIRYYQQALEANSSKFISKSEVDHPELTDYYNGKNLLNSLLYKAEAFEGRYFNRTLKFSELDNALSVLKHCDRLVDELRQRSTNEADKISLGAIASRVYADGVRIATAAASVAWKKQSYLELAFYFAEKSKSAVLLDAISESDAKSFAGIPAHLLEEEKNIKASIALTSQKLAQKPAEEEEKFLRETLFNLNRASEDFVKRLEKEYPSYFNLKFNAASPSIAQLQSLVESTTALLSYFIDEDHHRLYNFVITKGNFEIVEHELPSDFNRLITGFRNGIFFSAEKTFHQAGERLSRLLIPNLRGSVTELVILPAGRLGVIPFESLPVSSREGQPFATTRYLLNRYDVRYEFSAGLLLQKIKSETQAPLNIFLCAPVKFPDKDNLSDLPGTESEVANISKLFASKNKNANLLVGPDANEQKIKTETLKDYSLIHFATHGVVDESAPELSRIFLQDHAGEDGNLFAGEIYNLEMNANLVTLSACQTGLGKISKGEGVIGLSRALVYAGARNVMVSFWSVADESTSQLMQSFYKRLLEQPNVDYSQALRDAKLELMKGKKYSSPYYWAPFILIGF